MAVLSPLFVILIIVLSIYHQGSPFFVQSRSGYNERPFKLVKFKTMLDKNDERGQPLSDKERLTWLGKIIRCLSLDELPQLFNVICGDMSLIGPRPLLLKYLPLYSAEQRRRHEVKPGITGWAQVNGRNSISWTEKFAYDVYYVDNLSFWLDLKILWLTIIKVLQREGINQSEERPMQPFDGTN